MLPMNIPNKKYVWLGIVVVLLALCVSLKWAWSNKLAKQWSVVYLTSGEIYVAHLRTFPKLSMQDAYLLQNVKNEKNQQSNLQLFPLAEAAWAPTKLYLSYKQVIYFGPLDENSLAAKAIKEKGK